MHTDSIEWKSEGAGVAKLKQVVWTRDTVTRPGRADYVLLTKQQFPIWKPEWFELRMLAALLHVVPMRIDRI